MNLAIRLSTLLLFGVVWMGVGAWLRRRKRETLAYLAFFTIFYVYLCAVLDYTLLQFQSLLLLRHFMPHLIVNGVEAGAAVNLVPLANLTAADLRTSLLNVLLLVPFGFGLPFIASLRMRGVLVAGMLLSVAIELLQWATGIIGGITFRVADVDDVIFNSVGVAIGYALSAAFLRAYLRRANHRRVGAHAIARHIAERPQAHRRPVAPRR